MGRKPAAWATDVGRRCDRYEKAVRAATGCDAKLTCDAKRDQLILTLTKAPHPAALNSILDELSPLWPGLLAPAGVSLLVVDGGEWDGEEMALRYFQRRTAG